MADEMTVDPIELPDENADLFGQMLNGLKIAYPGSMQGHPCCHKLILEVSHKSGRVSVLMGGNADCAPFPTGFVGAGMIDAVLYGQSFAAPTPDEINEGLQIVSTYNGGAGIVVILPNNSAEKNNFLLGIEGAHKHGIKATSVLVGKNFPSSEESDSSYTSMTISCASVLIAKMAGAMSAEGKTLLEISSILKKVDQLISTFEVNLSSYDSTVKDSTENEDTECHNERCNLKQSQREIVMKKLRETCISSDIKQGDEVVILINHSNPNAQMEQWILVYEICKELSMAEIKVLRVFAGSLLCSKVDDRIQVCILNLRIKKKTEKLLHWLDEPTLAPAWPGGSRSITPACNSVPFTEFIIQQNMKLKQEMLYSSIEMSKLSEKGTSLMGACVNAAIQAVMNEEERLNSLGTVSGAGDYGTVLKRGAEAIHEKISVLPMECPAALLWTLANLCESHILGETGIMYSIFLIAAVPPLISVKITKEHRLNLLWAITWGNALSSGLDGVLRYNPRQENKKDLLNLLSHACNEYKSLPKRNYAEIILALKSCLPSADVDNTDESNKSKKTGADEGIEKLGYDVEACAAEVWIKAIIKEVNCYIKKTYFVM